jgi:hypothetical protein
MTVALLTQNQRQSKSVDREIEETAQVKSRQSKLLDGGDKARYHEKESCRYGGDRESARPYLTDSTNRREIMRMDAGGNKTKTPPQSHSTLTQRFREYPPVKIREQAEGEVDQAWLQVRTASRAPRRGSKRWINRWKI